MPGTCSISTGISPGTNLSRKAWNSVVAKSKWNAHFPFGNSVWEFWSAFKKSVFPGHFTFWEDHISLSVSIPAEIFGFFFCGGGARGEGVNGKQPKNSSDLKEPPFRPALCYFLHHLVKLNTPTSQNNFPVRSFKLPALSRYFSLLFSNITIRSKGRSSGNNLFQRCHTVW